MHGGGGGGVCGNQTCSPASGSAGCGGEPASARVTAQHAALFGKRLTPSLQAINKPFRAGVRNGAEGTQNGEEGGKDEVRCAVVRTGNPQGEGPGRRYTRIVVNGRPYNGMSEPVRENKN